MDFEISKEVLFQEILSSCWWRTAKSFRGTVSWSISQWTRLLALKGDTVQNCRLKQMWEPFFCCCFLKGQRVTNKLTSKNTQDNHPSSGNLFTSSFKDVQTGNGDRPAWKQCRNNTTVLSISIYNHVLIWLHYMNFKRPCLQHEGN